MARVVLRSVAQEGCTFQVTVNFYDASGDALTPDTAKWSLNDGAGATVNSRSDVSISSPTSEETITLVSADLVCSGPTSHDLRYLLVEWTYDSGKTGAEEIEFAIKDLVGV